MDPGALDEPRLARLIQVGRSLVARLDLEGVLGAVLDAARELTEARYAALGILDRDKQELERFLTLGIEEGAHAAIGGLPRGRGVLGELIRAPGPLRLTDLGRHPRSFGFPRGHPPMRTFLGVAIRIHGEAWGSIYLTEKEGDRDFDEKDEAALAVLADWAAIAIENARLYEGLARRRDEAERRRDQAEHLVKALGVMTEIAASVGGETDLDTILELIVSRGRALVQTRGLMILLAEREELVVAATAGEIGDDDLAGVRLPVEGTIPGRVLRAGRSEQIVGAPGLGAFLESDGVSAREALVVPLEFRGIRPGVLVALDRQGGGPGFDAEDQSLLRSLATSAATAVATAKSVEAERLRHSLEAAEQERNRWARELHDETLQAFGGLRMLYSAALRSGSDAADHRAAIEEGIELIDTEIDNLSALIAELRPPALDQIGLAAALRGLADRKGREGGMAIDVLVRLGEGDGRRLPSELENTLYRIVQEGLSNVGKHAGAARAEVLLEATEGRVELAVRDDGKGFDPLAATSGFGLAGMRERVELADGELRIDSEPGRGTTILVAIPVDGQGASARAARGPARS
jgi:two-component system, NarL family, sensor histidine kinase DevS